MVEPVHQQQQLQLSFLNGQLPLTPKINEMNMNDVSPVVWPKVESGVKIEKRSKGVKGLKKSKVTKKRGEMSAEQLERRREATRLRIRRLRSLRTPEQAARDREATMLRMRRLRSKQKEQAAQQRDIQARLKPMEGFKCKLESDDEVHLQRLAYEEHCVKSELQADGCYESTEYREEGIEPVFNGSVIVNGYHHVHAHHSERVAFTNCHTRGRTKGSARKIPTFEKKMKQIETMANTMALKEKLEAIKLMSSVLGRLCDGLKEGLGDDPILSYNGTGNAQLHHSHIVANNHILPPVHAVCETTDSDGAVLIGPIEVDHASDTRHVPFQVMNTQHETVGNDFFSAECAKYEPIVKISEDPCDTSQLHHQQQRTRSA